MPGILLKQFAFQQTAIAVIKFSAFLKARREVSAFLKARREAPALLAKQPSVSFKAGGDGIGPVS